MLPFKTDAEIYKECHDIWVTKSGYGWTHEEFMLLLGWLDPDQEVTLKNGNVVCGSIVSYWYQDLRSFEHGWICAYKHHMEKD